MKKLLFIVLSVISLTGFAADVHVENQAGEDFFSDVESEIIVYKILKDVQDDPQVASWDDLKSFAIDLYNKSKIFHLIMDAVLNELNITTVEEYLDCFGSSEFKRDILCRIAQVLYCLHVEIRRVQKEDSYDGWLEVVQGIEDQMHNGVFVEQADYGDMSAIKPLLQELEKIQECWNAQAGAGEEFFL